jgi:hypothetical protein
MDLDGSLEKREEGQTQDHVNTTLAYTYPIM